MEQPGFCDRIPLLLAEHRPRDQAMLVRAMRHGINIVRKAQVDVSRMSFSEPLRTVRFQLPATLVTQIDELQESTGLARRIITAMSLHLALIDPRAPGYNPAYCHLIQPSAIGHAHLDHQLVAAV